jgi:hypothetical protein
MPELHEDPAACVVNGSRHLFPAFSLRLRPNSGGALESARVRTHIGRLGYDEAGPRSLSVIFGVQVDGNVANARSAPRQRSHEHAISQFKRT